MSAVHSCARAQRIGDPSRSVKTRWSNLPPGRKMTKRKRNAASVYSFFSATLDGICLLITPEDGQSIQDQWNSIWRRRQWHPGVRMTELIHRETETEPGKLIHESTAMQERRTNTGFSRKSKRNAEFMCKLLI